MAVAAAQVAERILVVDENTETTHLLQNLSLDPQQTKTSDVSSAEKQLDSSGGASNNVCGVPAMVAPLSAERTPTPFPRDFVVEQHPMYYQPYSHQPYYFPGYEGPSPADWDDFRFVSNEGVEIPPTGGYGDNNSLVYHHHPGYGFAQHVPYGPCYSAAAAAAAAAGTPVPMAGTDAQIYAPHPPHAQTTFQYSCPFYHQQPQPSPLPPQPVPAGASYKPGPPSELSTAAIEENNNNNNNNNEANSDKHGTPATITNNNGNANLNGDGSRPVAAAANGNGGGGLASASAPALSKKKQEQEQQEEEEEEQKKKKKDENGSRSPSARWMDGHGHVHAVTDGQTKRPSVANALRPMPPPPVLAQNMQGVGVGVGMAFAPPPAPPSAAIGGPAGYINRVYHPSSSSSSSSSSSCSSGRMYAHHAHHGNSGRAAACSFGSNGYDPRPNGVRASWSFCDNKTSKLSRGGGGRGRGNGVLYSCNDGMDVLNEQNRGPRTTRFRNQRHVVASASPWQVKSHATVANGNIEEAANLVPNREQYNRPEFPTKYSAAKFFIIKSYSEDDVHKSIKYNVWASTSNGNKKLDTAYTEAQEKSEGCPIFLFFSVNASGQFCGVAEMIGPVDFDQRVDYWQQDKWSGRFPLKWHIVKDVPNNQLRHITLENNDKKPVTNSRDTQEVLFENGADMLKIFKDYVSRTSILDDFIFYEGRQKQMQEKRARQQQLYQQRQTFQSYNVKDLSQSFVEGSPVKAVERKGEPPSEDKNNKVRLRTVEFSGVAIHNLSDKNSLPENAWKGGKPNILKRETSVKVGDRGAQSNGS